MGNHGRQAQVPKPFLRWAGSKKKLLPQLSEFWSDSFKRYVEPFMGSAALFFSLDPKKAVLSDINEDLINAFIQVQAHPRAVHNRISKLPKGKEAYYKIRREGLKGSALDRAARFMYLNRFSFNGIYRTNLKGEFNVPYCNDRYAYLPTLEDLLCASRALSRAKIVASDFESILDRH